MGRGKHPNISISRSYISEGRGSMDEEAVLLHQKRPKKVESSQKKAKKKSVLNKKSSLPKIGQSFVQDSKINLSVAERQTSQSFLY